MYYALFGIILLGYILFSPWSFNYYTDGNIKARLVMFGFIPFPIDLRKLYKKFITRKTNEHKHFNIMEVAENIKKMVSVQPVYQDIFKRASIKHLYWYSAVPMTTPIVGLALLPVYSTVQTVMLDFVYNHFGKVRDVDVDTKFNYLDENVFLYFDCIIQINLGKIIIVGLKYANKIPVLLKRVT